MEVAHRSLLRGKRMVLCQSMDNDIVVKHLSKSNILTTRDLETLKATSSSLKNEKLLDILPKRGPKAFSAFLEALKLNKLVHLLGDGYEGKDDDVDKTFGNKNIKMNEERAAEKNTSKHTNVIKVDEKSYEIIDVPVPNRKESYDIVDAPHKEAYDEPMGVSLHSIGSNGDFDIVPDPGGKQAKVDDEPFAYDSVDTPFVVTTNVSTSFPTLTDQNGSTTTTTSKGMMLNMDVTDYGQSGKDATDSAPASAASPEFTDGPFHLKRKEAQEQPDSSALRTQDDSNAYPMSKTPRGYFMLINNKNFLPESTMEPYPRNGTDVDAAAIVALFEELGYIVESHRNATCYQIRRAVKTLVSKDYSKVSAVACCFLSHGKEGVLYGTDGEIEIKELTSYFREQRGLIGKPKMFFFQACQGSDYMDGVKPEDGRMEVDGPGDVYGNDISLPTEADFIYAYSTVPGYYSWRNSVKGSWFIQAIVEVFRKHAHKMDVIRMLTRVNQIVSTKKSSTGVKPSHNKRQICSIITQLRYELYLYPPHGPLKQLSAS